jgi:hypothetical protein
LCMRIDEACGVGGAVWGVKAEFERTERGVRIAAEVGLCKCGRGKKGWTSLPLLKTTTTMRKGKGETSNLEEEMPDSLCPSQTHERKFKISKVKDKVRPALLVLTL